MNARALCSAALLFLGCTPRPGFETQTPALAELGKGLPPGFLFGAATSSHQIEGGLDNDWTEWERGSFPDGTPHIANGDQSGLAADSWNRFDEDLALLKTLGANTYRFSVEWSRLEPTKGAWDAAAMARYREWATKLRAAGIEPMVTLHHFTLPRWVSEQGGFEGATTPDDFAAFSRRVATELGDLVDLWCPINEINVYSTLGYLTGEWPPGVKDDQVRQIKVMRELMRAHAKAAAELRAADTSDADGDGKATLITHAHHVRIFQAASHSVLDTAITGLTDDVFNEVVPRGFKTGRFQVSVPGTIDLDEEIPGLKDSIDVLGLNYYTRDMVRADLGSASLSQMYYRPGRSVSDLGWDLYPDGLYQMLVRYHAYGWPLFVTENGTADTDDDFRELLFRQHVAAMERAVSEGVNLRGYYYWSLIDNFEWAEGYGPRFGLFKVDYTTFARTPTRAVKSFQVIRANLP